MKLFSNYNHTFNVGYSPALDIWDLIKDIPSLNSFYVAFPSYLTESMISVDTNLKVSSWYNLLGDTNYLYATNNPTLNLLDSQFNYNPSVDFNNDGTQQLLFKFPVLVGTMILVYSTRVTNSYIIYAPRVEAGDGTSWLHYDAFPPGNTVLWANEPKLSGSIFNASSRINGKDTTSNTFIPLNSTRILTINNISNAIQKETINGFGGQTGAVGGVWKSTPSPGFTNSFKGKLAAVITFEDNISNELLLPVEAELAKIYINYQGVTISNTPSFRYLVGDSFNFDFSTIAVDEWFNIESYELVEPLTLGISFLGSILSGYLTNTYYGKFKIKITNSNNQTSIFQFNLEIIKPDPIVLLLPQPNDISLILSTSKDITDESNYSNYGLYTYSGKVLKWEDARRLPNKPLYVGLENFNPLYSESDVDFNNQSTVVFSSTSKLQGTTVSGKTFIWVYQQSTYGSRNMLDTFPDIKGQGQLWTVSNTSQIHGSSPVTKLQSTVNRLSVNTLSYKLDLNNLSIIVATQPDDLAISFSGLTNMKGKLAMFISWSVLLTTQQINDVTTLLANKYFSNLSPLIVDSSTEYRTVSNISIDLSKKVLDIRGEVLTYNITTNPNSASITDNVLSFTSNTDELLYYEIECTNESNLSTILKFYVDITLRTNSLYIGLKQLLLNFNLFLLPESDTLTVDTSIVQNWKDYRLNGKSFDGTGNIILTNFNKTDNKNFLNFNINGSDTFIINNADNISGSAFIFAYIKKNNSLGKFFLLGQEDNLDFTSGDNNNLFDLTATSSSILSADKYANGKLINNSYLLKNNILNILVINSTKPMSFTRIGKDRVFIDRSVKGYLGLVMVLNRNVTSNEQASINTLIRDYYDSSKYITLLSFNNNLIDKSILNKTININTTNNLFSSVNKKFGGHSIQLVTNSVCNALTIPNNTSFAFLNEDFTISMWLAINIVTLTTESLVIYNQTDLIIFLSGYVLYVNNSLNKETAIVSYTLPVILFSNSYTFFQIELTRSNSILRLFINGTLVSTNTYDIEIRDDSTDPKIGQTNNLNSISTLNMYVDEFMVYRRLALHTGSFTPPVSEYV